MAFSDQEIIEAIRGGRDQRALSYLYKKVLPKVKKYILSNSGTEDEAYDIFQDAIVAFYKYVQEDKYNTKYEIDGFIYTISRNLWINRAKREQRKLRLNEAHQNIGMEDDVSIQLINEERGNLIKSLINQLGERCKELLILAIYHKMPLHEITEKMGFSNENTTKTKKYKCKKRLMELIEQNPSIKKELKQQ